MMPMTNSLSPGSRSCASFRTSSARELSPSPGALSEGIQGGAIGVAVASRLGPQFGGFSQRLSGRIQPPSTAEQKAERVVDVSVFRLPAQRLLKNGLALTVPTLKAIQVGEIHVGGHEGWIGRNSSAERGLSRAELAALYVQPAEVELRLRSLGVNDLCCGVLIERAIHCARLRRAQISGGNAGKGVCGSQAHASNSIAEQGDKQIQSCPWLQKIQRRGGSSSYQRITVIERSPDRWQRCRTQVTGQQIQGRGSHDDRSRRVLSEPHQSDGGPWQSRLSRSEDLAIVRSSRSFRPVPADHGIRRPFR